MKTATFNRYVNDPTTTEQELHRRSGQTVELIEEPFAPDLDEPSNVMQKIRFSDGYDTVAFIEELTA